MILQELYTIIELIQTEKNVLSAKISLNNQHPVFSGHFPNQPVVPGVCLTNIITEILSQSQNQNYFLKSADFIKFINVVVPSSNNTLFISLKSSNNLSEEVIKIEGSIFFENTTFLKIKGLYSLKK